MAKVNPIQLQKHLKGMEYPASKQDIVDYAKQQSADDNAIAILEQLPEEEYETPTDVNKAVGEVQ
jgi:hypothetical protein